eukprot:TRINITY_DN31881_c0_g1_i1.p1 TRINITY_DN31881_c0_g1~~TRINITY_DN31881_c0_g1_i1.p1  ORF type:complete len:400 (-),score=83.85 TRINITY_DN31881_c0_g1_i1:28-1227(-)
MAQHQSSRRMALLAALLLAGARDATAASDAGRALSGRGHLRANAAASLHSSSSARKAAPFPFLDDMEPVAPFDRVAPPGGPNEAATAKIAVAGGPELGATRRPALYIPPYLYPDAFPSVQGSSCVCEAPKVEKPTKKDEIWAAEVAKQLGLPLSQVMTPNDFKGIASCDCGDAKPSDGQVYRWVKIQANGSGSSAFSLSPADGSFPSGSYWKPDVVSRAGLVAPEDRLPAASFPVQAPYDEVELGAENLAVGDQISPKFARYLDQVDGRASDSESLVPCGAGDKVHFEVGNTRKEVLVLAAGDGNTVQIQAETSTEGEECQLKDSCSTFRVCKPQAVEGSDKKKQRGRCVAQVSEEFKTWDDHVERKFSCPTGTAVCKSVKQVVQANYLKKDGKLCKPV